MEIKAELIKPYTLKERVHFVAEQNNKNGYKIEEREDRLVALGLTDEEQKAKKRERLDALILTPSDVERALYKAKKMNFEMLKEYIKEKIPNIDMIALDIEFRATAFYRGAVFGENDVRLFDVIGALLGYNAEDMDYLFINKSLPEDNETN